MCSHTHLPRGVRKPRTAMRAPTTATTVRIKRCFFTDNCSSFSRRPSSSQIKVISRFTWPFIKSPGPFFSCSCARFSHVSSWALLASLSGPLVPSILRDRFSLSCMARRLTKGCRRDRNTTEECGEFAEFMDFDMREGSSFRRTLNSGSARIIGDSILFFEPAAKSQPNSGHNN